MPSRNSRPAVSPFAFAGAVFLLSGRFAGAQQFSVDDVSGAFEDPNAPVQSDGETVTVSTTTSTERAEARSSGLPVLELQKVKKKGNLFHNCGCKNANFNFEPDGYEGLRSKSDKFLQGGNGETRDGWSNAVWAWGQFMDHDMVTTVDADGEPNYPITITSGGKSAVMTLHRLVAENKGKCRAPIVASDPRLDASMIYGNSEAYLKNTLREPNSCRMRTSSGDLLPVTTGEDQAGKHRLIAGDSRVNEHGVLASMHTIWLREHNRLCGEMDADTGMSDDDKFERARNVVRAKIQQITVNEFLPALGISKNDVQNFDSNSGTTDIAVEFMIAYRFGHDIILNNIGSFKTQKIFDGEKFFDITSAEGSADPSGVNSKMNSLMTNVVNNKAGNLDGRFSDALRNTLFGSFGEDLGTRNMFRSLELGMVGYNELAECYGVTPDRQTVLFNRFAKDDNPTLALLRENAVAPGGGEPMGPVNKAIITDQFHRVIFGSNGLWWGDNKGGVQGFESEVESASFAKVLNDNLSGSYSGNVFAA